MSLPRYPEYKDSGVEWLGEVPGHWYAGRFSRAIEAIKDGTHGTFERVPLGRPLLSAKNVQDGYVLVADDESMVSEADHLSITANGFPRKGDLLLTIVGTIGRSCVYEFEDPIAFQRSVSFIRLLPGNETKFFYYFTQSKFFQEQLASRSKSAAQGGVYMGDVVATSIVFPPLPEQTQIAAFLDLETSKIDSLVAEQRRLMELLKEKRQAVISHAVTRGLNPDAPLKPSGIEWLGDVPEHWRVGKCGFYLSILSGYAFPSTGFSTNDSDTRLLRGINVGVARLKWDEVVYWNRSTDDDLSDYEMRVGDLVIGMDRPLISEGMRVAKVKDGDLPCLLLQRVASLKTGPLLNSDYLLHLLSSEMFVAHFSPDTTGVSVPHISPDQINNFVVPVPPMSEQLEIVGFIANELAKFDTLTTEAQRAIDLLQERRTALISAAVTGQIDVRGAVVA